MELELRSVDIQEAHEAGGRAQAQGARPATLVDKVWSLGLDSFASIFYIFQK